MTRLLLGSYTPVVYDVEFTPPTESSPPRLEKVRDLPIGWGASWLTRHPTHRDVWYVALEADDDGGVKLGVEGHIAAYRITESGAELLSQVSAVDNPCHVEVVGSGRGLAVANVSERQIVADRSILREQPC
jgi:6-phosphogluconolactonase (cycloisomerase 2 family)